jgi:hypothetical protein
MGDMTEWQPPQSPPLEPLLCALRDLQKQVIDEEQNRITSLLASFPMKGFVFQVESGGSFRGESAAFWEES